MAILGWFKRPQLMVADGEQVQWAVRQEMKGFAGLLLDIRRNKMSSTSVKFLERLGLDAIDYTGMEVERKEWVSLSKKGADKLDSSLNVGPVKGKVALKKVKTT